MEDLNNKVTGGTLTATEWNQVPSELQNVIQNTGQVLTNADLNQLGKGIAQYAATGNYYIDSGAINSFVLTASGLKQASPAYTAGMKVRFTAANSVSGASIINLNSLGAIDAKYIDGSDLKSGQIKSGDEVEFIYNGSDFIFSPIITPTTYGDLKTGRRNLFINASMIISQKGTAFAFPPANTYTLDRWVTIGSAVDNVARTGSQLDTIQVVTSAGVGGIGQRVEAGANGFLAGEVFTLSFLMLATDVDVDIEVNYKNGNLPVSNIIPKGSISSQLSAGVLSKVVVTFTLPSDVNLITSNNMEIAISSDVVNTFELSKPQLERSAIPTDFEYVPPGETLRDCQRYFEALTYQAGEYITVSQATSSTQTVGVLNYCEKRAMPTITIASGTLVAATPTGGSALGNFSTSPVSNAQARVIMSGTIALLTAGYASSIIAFGGTAILHVNSEF